MGGSTNESRGSNTASVTRTATDLSTHVDDEGALHKEWSSLTDNGDGTETLETGTSISITRPKKEGE